MDTLDKGLRSVLLSYMDTPRDAVRLAAVSKSLHDAEAAPSTRYRWMCAAAGDAGAMGWLRARARRVDAARIDCDDAPMEALREAHAAAQSNTRIQLELQSELFSDLLAMLASDCAAVTSLLKRHVAARLGGAAQDSAAVRNLQQQLLNGHGYDTDHDAYARASFAWNCDAELALGECGQLRLQLQAWQGADAQHCKFHLEVRRCSDNELLHATGGIFVDEHTAESEWWLHAAELYTQVKQFEFWELEDADGSEFSEFDDESDED